MDTPRALLVVGVRRRDIVEALSKSARESGLEAEVTLTAEETAEWLEAHDPRAIAIDMGSPGAEATCLQIRSEAKRADVPIIGLTRDLDDLAFPEMYGWGGDDVIALAAPRTILPRLRALGTKSSLHPPPLRGTAVVGDSDRRRRVVLARVLHNAGYDVRYAVDSADAIAASRAQDVQLVVADAELGPGGGAAAAAAARDAGCAAAWVLVAEPKRLGAVRASVTALAKVAVTDAFAPPENVLFVANELGRPRAVDGRASVRLLYGTVVGFRVAGRDEDGVGFTYNVSSGGVYVRTLAPLSSGDEVWLELRPPRTDRRVRLDGRVAWRRAFGPIESATVPPGFGVQICDGSSSDLARYRTGCETLAADLLGVAR